ALRPFGQLPQQVRLVRALPGHVQIVAPEMAVGRGRTVDRAPQIQHADDARRPQVKVFADELRQLFFTDFAGTVRIDADGNRLCDADGVGELDFALVRQARRHNVLRHVAGR